MADYVDRNLEGWFDSWMKECVGRRSDRWKDG